MPKKTKLVTLAFLKKPCLFFIHYALYGVQVSKELSKIYCLFYNTIKKNRLKMKNTKCINNIV